MKTAHWALTGRSVPSKRNRSSPRWTASFETVQSCRTLESARRDNARFSNRDLNAQDLLRDNWQDFNFNSVEFVEARPCATCGQTLFRNETNISMNFNNLKESINQWKTMISSFLEKFPHSFIIKTIGTVEDNTLLFLVLKYRPLLSQSDGGKISSNFKTNLS